jgi:hypothetical protein
MFTEWQFDSIDTMVKVWRDRWHDGIYMRDLASSEFVDIKPGLRSGRTF